jgi:hypothetical protein
MCRGMDGLAVISVPAHMRVSRSWADLRATPLQPPYNSDTYWSEAFRCHFTFCDNIAAVAKARTYRSWPSLHYHWVPLSYTQLHHGCIDRDPAI